MNDGITINADALVGLRTIESDSVDMCITSPPYYGLRDYGAEGQIGLEETPEEYIGRLVDIFHEVRRVMRKDGTLWVNIADSYAGSCKGRNMDGSHTEGFLQSTNKGSITGKVGPTHAEGCKRKDLIGIPWLLAFALRNDGWYLRQDIIWNKPNAMPESVKDRCTKSHEYIFLLSKSPTYYFDHENIKEPRVVEGAHKGKGSGNLERKERKTPSGGLKGNIPYSGDVSTRSRRDVWNVSTRGGKGEHFAVFPEEIARTCILAGSRVGGVVLDPFFGSGTSGAAAQKLGRRYIGIEINAEFASLAERRISEDAAQLVINATI